LIVMTTEIYPGVTAWRFFFHIIPGANAIRALPRVSLLFLIPAAVGVAAFFEKPRKLGVTIFLLALLVAEQVQPAFNFSKQEARERASHLVKAVPRGCPSFLYDPPPAERTLPDYVYQIDAMIASLELGIPTLNGFSGSVPPGWKGSAEAAKGWMQSYGDSSFCVVSSAGS
jgi:hypothetical protein